MLFNSIICKLYFLIYTWNEFLILTLLLSIYSFGQLKSEKLNGLKITETTINAENDTIIKVIYKNEVENNKKPAIFINEKLVNESILKTINPKEIESVNIEKNDIEIENVNYYGKIKITKKETGKRSSCRLGLLLISCK